MATHLRILLVSSSDETAAWLTETLRSGGRLPSCLRVGDDVAYRAALADGGWDAVVCDATGPGRTAATKIVAGAAADGLRLPMIFLGAEVDDVAADALSLGAMACARRSGLAHLGPAFDGIARAAASRGEEAARAAFDEGQRQVLEQIARGAPLPELLERIVTLVERQAADMLCSILLLDRARGCVRHGAAPSLPIELSGAIDGVAIGPDVGSCGTAAYSGEEVVVEDIATHPYWTRYRHLALPWGLRACWSTPIFSAEHEVLGTFAMYYREPRGPTARERTWVGRATHLAAIAISRDRAVHAIRASESLRVLVDRSVSDIVFYVGVEATGDFRFLSVNPAFLKATGLGEEQVVGRRVADVIPERSRETVLANYARAIRERRTVAWLETSVYPAGKRHGEVSVTPIFDDDGGCTHLAGTVRDVTERRQADEHIAAQAALLDRAKDAILVRAIDGTIRYWNSGAQRLYGWSSAEAVGRHVADLIYGDRRAFEQAQARLLERGEWTGELTQKTKAGREVTIEASWTLLGEGGGSGKEGEEGSMSVLAINTDITERKRLETQVLNRQRLDSLGTLARGIAHDFNNILTAIVSNVQLAEMELPASHPARELLSEVDRASARAGDLVRQILTFSREHKLSRRVVALPPVVDDALRLLRATLPASIEIQSRFAPDLPAVLADPTQIHQVVMNLGTNAGHAIGRRQGVLDVQAERVVVDGDRYGGPTAGLSAGPYARITVRDTGCGMDQATLDRIFDPFFTTRGPDQGTGLGLSVVHGIVKSHHGAIVVDSAPGRGTTFRLYLPAAEAGEAGVNAGANAGSGPGARA